MDYSLETTYKDLVKFHYCSFDRMVIRGHVPVLQGKDGGGVVCWARSIDPKVVLTKSWFEAFAAKFHINVNKFAEEHSIAIISVDRKQDKNEIAKQHLPEDQNYVGVYLIIKAREMASSYASHESKHNSNPLHRNITREDRCIDHFYFYLIDKYWGPICFRISSHLPFNVKVYLNGNRWLVREAFRNGLQVTSSDNAITDVDDPVKLQTIADSLNYKKIQSVCDHWIYRLLPVLTYEERYKSRFRYEWFLHQIEYSHNMVFKNSLNLTKLFHQHIASNYEHFHPLQIQRYFGHRSGKKYKVNCDVNIHHHDEAITVLRIRSRECSLRQYNKFQRIFRSEITVNNVKDLHVGKSISNLQKLKDRMQKALFSFQENQSSVHQAICSSGEIAALSQPGMLGSSRIPGIKIENDRIMTLLAMLPCLAHYPEGFRLSELRELIFKFTKKDYSIPQLAYDLRKIRAKKLVCRFPHTNRYTITPQGVRISVVLPSLADKLCNPLISLCLYSIKSRLPEKLQTPLDQHYYNIEKETSIISELLGLNAA